MNFKSYIALKEAILRTYPLELTIRKMNERWANFLIDEFQKEDNLFIGKIVATPRFDIEKIKRDGEFFGYFLSNIFKEGSEWTLVFSPKVAESDSPSKNFELYHLCPKSVFHKINKIGITPRKSSKKDWPHPGDRSYLLKVDYENMNPLRALLASGEIQSIFENIVKASGKTLDDYIVIKIKTSPELEKTLHVDPSFPKRKGMLYYGVYTNKNIPPSLFEKTIDPNNMNNEVLNAVVRNYGK